METMSSQSPLAQSTQQTSSTANTSKNFRNWFDEFKAKVSKKSQSNQVTNSDQSTNQPDEARKDDPATVATNTASLSNVQSAPASSQTKAKGSSLRARRPLKLSSTDSEFDSSYMNSSSIRRYESKIREERQPSLYSRLLTPLGWVICYLIPFNATLPWKLLCLINTSIVIIVIGIASGSSQTSTALSFCNGFIGGLFVACFCFILLGASFLFHIMPKSQDKSSLISSVDPPANKGNDTGKRNLKSEYCIGSKETNDSCLNDTQDVSDTKREKELSDYSIFEMLDDDTRYELSESQRSVASKLDDENFKGWMIEFIGDYENRNTSEIKLKSIFVRIEYGVLYLCKPKNSHDVDTTTFPTITNQRVHDLNDVLKLSVNLLIPKNVRNKQKYVWSKKYPIRLEFQESQGNDTGGKNGAEQSCKSIQLTLFAKSCREKEEWFRRFRRIVDESRLAQGPAPTKNLKSPKSDETTSNTSNGESLFDSFRRFRRRSPSPKRDCVQTSQSSHLLTDQKQTTLDEVINKKTNDAPEYSSASPSSTGLVRTKSCEIIDPGRSHSSASDASHSKQSTDDEDDVCKESVPDDSTLTRETADLFSQALGYSNFIDSQPTLDYKDYIERVIASSSSASLTSDWFNALTGRIFFDVFSHSYWAAWFKRKIQRKLYRIRLPYFMENLTLTTIDLGTNAPQFLSVVSHRLDSYGLSIDFDMSYSGGLTMTFETKLNLLKIKSDNAASKSDTNSTAGGPSNIAPGSGNQAENNPISQENSALENQAREASFLSKDLGSTENLLKESQPALPKPQVSSSSTSVRTSGGTSTSDSDGSDSDSSSDSSFEEADVNEISDWEDYGAEKTRQNIVKFVDKIASSRYFQHATENRYIKKKLQDLSNCPLVLVVQIQSLNGILTLNVPPPQTDRIWYGFKPTPELILKALPKMGDREVSLSHVTDWIERKLAEEFRKILIIPNMEDIVLPVLKSDHLQYITATK